MAEGKRANNLKNDESQNCPRCWLHRLDIHHHRHWNTSRFLTSRIKYCNVCTTQHSVSCDAFLFLPIHQLASASWGI